LNKPAKITGLMVIVCATALGVFWFVLNANASTWDPKSAAAYLDRRESAWAAWPGAARDEGTFCVSCHTALPYALARSGLSAKLNETVPPAAETALLADVTKRIREWNGIKPYYASKR
jgi:squalene-hopene/tetraprenyl-beta-curcumene cyclase